jgi:ATP-dependent Clp protease adapter protein ClpS
MFFSVDTAVFADVQQLTHPTSTTLMNGIHQYGKPDKPTGLKL